MGAHLPGVLPAKVQEMTHGVKSTKCDSTANSMSDWRPPSSEVRGSGSNALLRKVRDAPPPSF